jgi:hypothetical protein
MNAEFFFKKLLYNHRCLGERGFYNSIFVNLYYLGKIVLKHKKLPNLHEVTSDVIRGIFLLLLSWRQRFLALA